MWVKEHRCYELKDSEDVTKLIEDKRVYRFLTKKELSDLTGYDRNSMSRWTKSPDSMSFDAAHDYLYALGMTLVVAKKNTETDPNSSQIQLDFGAIGKFLKSKREEMGLSQSDVAEILSIKKRQTVGAWEDNSRPARFNSVTRLLDMYGYDLLAVESD